MSLSQFSEREALKLTTLEYTIESDGHFTPEPIVQLFCRDESGERRMVEVEGFYPFFYITEQDYIDNEQTLFNDTTVRSIEAREGLTSDENIHNNQLAETEEAPKQTLKRKNLVKIYTVLPKHVKELRETELFSETWEADVFFTNRFLVDSDVEQGFTIPRGKERIPYDELEAVEGSIDVDPRMVTIDIEVWAEGGFPDVSEANRPVTAVAAHDSYDDEYIAAVLSPDAVEEGADNSWGYWRPTEEDIRVFDDEAEMLNFINQWIIEKDPDLLSGWNSSSNDKGSGFDYPYWLNRCQRINEWSYKDLSPVDKAFTTDHGRAIIGGRDTFDMLQAYKKTQIHEKRSYSLDYIAQEELGRGKEDILGFDEGWLHYPAKFAKYNIRDVEATVEIERSKRVLDIYDHIRSITGATYGEIADSNIGIIDVMYLRRAGKRGIALPTSVRPDVQHYWGAYVFPPKAGKHRRVVYPDLSSLYPNLFRDMNASPETIVGFEEDLRVSQYTKDDCHTVYVDTRSETVKRNVDEPERTPLYVLKPEVQESFVRETIQDLIDMKYEYKKDEYSDEAYEAIKRITNSVYGVMGDSTTYGKGFRLFDWRIAEAITLAGRDVIKHTAEEFEGYVRDNGYPDSETVAGDTDSCVCRVDPAESMEEVLEIAQEAAKYVDSTYDEFMKDRYNMDENNMAVEIESYADAALFMSKKKRYAQLIKWDEGDLVDEIEIKGFESVRSDSASVTEDLQIEVIELILRKKGDDAKQAVKDLVKGTWDDIITREIDLEEIGRPSAIKNDLMDYGWSIQEVDEDDDPPIDIDGERLYEGDEYINYYSPQPHICGARYANTYIDGEEIEQGDKPLMWYVESVSPTNGFSEVYDYDHLSLNDPGDLPVDRGSGMEELGREVHALAVNDINNIPREMSVDYEKMAEKTVRDPIETVITTVGWDFDDLIADGKQAGLEAFM